MEQQIDVLPIIDARDIVMKFIKAINEEDFKTARTYVSDYVKFVGTTTSRDGAENYFEDLRHQKQTYNVRKTFLEGEDVCILYDITISGIIVFACGWYQVSGGMISTIKIVYDPRPILNLTAEIKN